MGVESKSKGGRVVIERPYIPDISKSMLLDLDQLVKADWNYKEQDEKMDIKLKNNLIRNNQIEILLVREHGDDKYEVVNGNHRYDVMKDIGYLKVWCYNLGKISDEEAKRIAIETNETKYAVNHQIMAKLIKELGMAYSMEELMESLPYTQEEVENYMQMHDFDWEDYEKQSTDSVASDDKVKKAKENELHLTLNADVLAQWNEWKERCGETDNNYNSFKLLLEHVL